jgi:ankyrin repeat protein
VISITKKLIDLGVDINGLSEIGITPLVAAVFMENTQLVELLIENGALIDLMNKDAYKSTALFVAAQIGNDEIVNILLQHGADPNKEGYFYPDVKSVPLVEAVMYSRDYLSTKLLLEYGANPTVEGRGGFLLSFIIAQMSKNDKPEKFVDLFIKHGVDINHMGEYEITPLDLAYRRKSRPDSSQESDMIIKALKQAGAKTYRELKDVELKKQQLAAE